MLIHSNSHCDLVLDLGKKLVLNSGNFHDIFYPLEIPVLLPVINDLSRDSVTDTRQSSEFFCSCSIDIYKTFF